VEGFSITEARGSQVSVVISNGEEQVPRSTYAICPSRTTMASGTPSTSIPCGSDGGAPPGNGGSENEGSHCCYGVDQQDP